VKGHVVSGCRLFVAGNVQDLLAAHSTDAFRICTALAVFGLLMQCGLARLALRVDRCPGFLLGEQLVLIELAPTPLCCVTSTGLPLVGHNDLAQLVLALLTHHAGLFVAKTRAAGFETPSPHPTLAKAYSSALPQPGSL